jgi:hypothetical protein
VVEIEDEIRREVLKRAFPPDGAHAYSYEWRSAMWRERSGADNYARFV